MTATNKGNRQSVASWKRPGGPINVWRIIEGIERLDDGKTRPCRFSIQDVPEERYEEAVEHMLEYFVAEEVTCKCLNIKDEPAALDDFRSLWNYLLKIGLSVGAYKLGPSDELLELVAINMLFVATDEIEEALGNFTMTFKSANSRKIFEFMHDVSKNADIRDIHPVDKYISALGLSVKPAFRGQKLGVVLLKARDDIGRKYGITATSTIFTAQASQIQAERAGFETIYTRHYVDALDENGKPIFPGITAKSMKIMSKRLQ